MKIALLIATASIVFTLRLIGAGSPSRVVELAGLDAGNPSHLVEPAVVEGSPDAAQVFSRNCAKCHGNDGRAKGLKAKMVGARNLTDAEWQGRVTDERLFNSINNGKGKMPAFGKKLSEAEVDELVRYVRGLKK
jgi:mono/diheme cytochrome c family protein